MGASLVTGGAGFIGSNLVAALLDTGERVRVVDDLSTGHRENLESLPGSARLEMLEGDVRDGGLMAEACRGIEIVYHQAALGSVPRSIEAPVETHSVNAHGTVVVLDAARNAGVRRVIYAASSSAYGDTESLPKAEAMIPAPLSPYAVSKVASEHYMSVFASVYGMETLSLRYFNVFGPNQRPEGAYAAAIPKFGWAAIRGELITVYGDGEQTRDFCFIDNAVRANLLAGATERRLTGQVVNVAAGERVTINEVIREIGRVLGKTPRVEHGEARAGDVRHSLADVSRARELLGYEVSVRWPEGVARTLPWLERLNGRSVG